MLELFFISVTRAVLDRPQLVDKQKSGLQSLDSHNISCKTNQSSCKSVKLKHPYGVRESCRNEGSLIAKTQTIHRRTHCRRQTGRRCANETKSQLPGLLQRDSLSRRLAPLDLRSSFRRREHALPQPQRPSATAAATVSSRFIHSPCPATLLITRCWRSETKLHHLALL